MEEEAAKLTQQVEKQQQKVQVLQEEVKDSLSIPGLGISNGQHFGATEITGIKCSTGKGRLEMT